MHIEMITISNYKSFLEKQTLHLEPGFNLLLGTNNAGKTTVLEVINMDLNLNEPHRSERSMQQHGDLNHQPSVFEVTLRTQFSELRRMIGSPQVYLPLKLKFGDMAEAFISEQMLAFLKKDELLRITSIFGSGADSVSVMSGVLVGGVASRHNATHLHAALIQFVPNSQNPQIHTSNYAGNQTEIGNYGQLLDRVSTALALKGDRVHDTPHKELLPSTGKQPIYPFASIIFNQMMHMGIASFVAG